MAIILGEVWGLPVKVIPSFSAVCLDFPSILFIVRHNMVLSVLWSMLSTNSLHYLFCDPGAQFAFYLLHVSGPVSLLEVDVGSVPAGDEVSVVCNPIRMGRWSELMVVSVVP